jgi:hypothetical protein
MDNENLGLTKDIDRAAILINAACVKQNAEISKLVKYSQRRCNATFLKKQYVKVIVSHWLNMNFTVKKQN